MAANNFIINSELIEILDWLRMLKFEHVDRGQYGEILEHHLKPSKSSFARQLDLPRLTYTGPGARPMQKPKIDQLINDISDHHLNWSRTKMLTMDKLTEDDIVLLDIDHLILLKQQMPSLVTDSVIKRLIARFSTYYVECTRPGIKYPPSKAKRYGSLPGFYILLDNHGKKLEVENAVVTKDPNGQPRWLGVSVDDVKIRDFTFQEMVALLRLGYDKFDQKLEPNFEWGYFLHMYKTLHNYDCVETLRLTGQAPLGLEPAIRIGDLEIVRKCLNLLTEKKTDELQEMIREGVKQALKDRNGPVFDFLVYKLEKPLDLTEIIQNEEGSSHGTQKLLKIVKEHVGKNSKGLITIDFEKIVTYLDHNDDPGRLDSEVNFFVEYVRDREGEFDYDKYIKILTSHNSIYALGGMIAYGVAKRQLKVVQIYDDVLDDPAAEVSDIDI